MTDVAIFRPDGPLFIPLPDACGPWSPDLMHGGPVFGLIARAVEASLPDPTFIPTRLSFDLFRAVPLVPLGVRTTLLRQSSRLCLIQASVVAGDEEFVRATVLLLAESDAGESHHEAARPEGPDGLPSESLMRLNAGGVPPNTRAGFHIRVETRWVPRDGDAPLAIWFRLPVPMIAGEEQSAFARATALSDFANAIATIAQNMREPRATPFINVDATLYFTRRPEGEWFCLQERATSDERGVSIAECTLYDTRGLCGRVSQSRLANRVRR